MALLGCFFENVIGTNRYNKNELYSRQWVQHYNKENDLFYSQNVLRSEGPFEIQTED